MAKNDNRVTVTIKLTPGRDDDLIAWWGSLDAGEPNGRGGKQAAAKGALRAGLGVPLPEPTMNAEPPQTAPGEQIEGIMHELGELRAAVSRLSNVKAGTGIDGAELDELRDKMQWAEQALTYLNEQFERMGGIGTPETPQVSQAPQATDEQLTKRKNKLKGAW